MPILETDIKLMKSERMYDEDDGGGRMTGNAIVGGLSNEIFPDVSELDRTYGRLNLRKIFPAVITNNVETYAGVQIIIAEPPSDPAVKSVLFQTSTSTAAWSDERAAAQDKIESYITIGPLSPMRLVGNHYEGQRALLAYQLTTDPLPDVGTVLALNNETANLRQYVRVTGVEDIEVTYTDSDGQFIRTELTLTISDPLLADFAAGAPDRHSTYQPATEIHRTNAIPAVSYFGISPLKAAASFGSRTLQVENYKENLLPATQAEEPLLDVPAGNGRSLTLDAGSRDVTISQVENTASLAISAGNRGYSYVFQLLPKPAPGTLTVAFRAMGKWYKLADETGSGQLTGSGSGSIIYSTGSGAVTLAEMPDSDTDIILGWGSGDDLAVATAATIDPPEYRYTVAHTPIKPSSVTITWLSAGVTKTLTDNGTGVLSGAGSGWVLYADGEIVFTPTDLPDPGETPQVTYTQYAENTENFAGVVPDAATGEISLSLTDQPVAGSVRVSYNTQLHCTAPDLFWPETLALRPGQQYSLTSGGVWLNAYYVSLHNYRIAVRMSDNAAGAFPAGAVDYAAKTITLGTKIPAQSMFTYYSGGGGVSGGSATAVSELRKVTWKTSTITASADVTVAYAVAGATESTFTEDVPNQLLQIDLCPHSIATVTPGSVAFTLAGHTYWDIEGVIHRDVDANTGVGTVSGAIDYQTGRVTLTDWIAGPCAITVTSLLIENYPWQVVAYQGYANVAPVRPGSFTLAATAADGELLTATADASGVITGDSIRGNINVETGIFELEFGELLLDADLSADEKTEPWYDAENVTADGHIWRPRAVWPATIRYNCVAYVYMPLSSDILGIDPVRLPLDGRVPIYGVGYVVVIHHTQTTEISNPANGQVIDCGCERLAWVKLVDANGDPVATDKYTVDLDAGTVTLDDVTGLTAPLTLTDRIEDMRLINDVEINGTLTVTKALSHDFPLGTYVSSALILGDMFARVTNIFEQNTWTGAWSDDLIGSAPLASFNNTLYPITVTNAGATQERWAVIFTSSTAFKVVGEYSGQIAVGDINTDFAPINPATGVPYLTIPALGWGQGWATGNVLRLNTIAANRPVQIARTILQSETASGSDQFCIETRGGVDTPS